MGGMMKRSILIIAAIMLMGCMTHAQTVKWLVKPQFASITHYSDDIFKCIDHKGELKLIDWNGQSIVMPANADSVTDYSDGYAVVLKGDMILGFLPEAKPHTFQSVGDGYYATKYSFFSEGYVAVAKGSAGGKRGYMDSKGILALDCQYFEAMPVRKGRALVWEKGKKEGPRYKRVEDWTSQGMVALKKGTSFTWATSYNTSGKALTRLGNNKREFVEIDVNFNVVKRDVKGSKDDVNSLDYSYKPEGSDEISSLVNHLPNRDEEYTTYDKGGKKGFKTSKGSVVPAQFDEALDFYANRAIVSKDGYYGIIELLGGKFEPNWSAEKIRVYEYSNEVESLQFMLTAPASLDNSKLKLEFDKGDGRYVDCNGLRCDFKVADQVIGRKSQECTLHAKATYIDNGFPDLLLWEDSQTVSIEYISVSLNSPVVTSEYADENDNQTVEAVVTNTSDVAVRVSATLNVAGRSIPFNGVLGPNQKQTLKVTIKVDNDKQVQASVSAKVDKHDCGSKSAYVSLKKI